MARLAPDELATGREAFEGRDWERAFELLAPASDDPSADPTDLERLAEAARWTGRFVESVDVLERAYAAFNRVGDRPGAARQALALCREHYQRLDEALAAGWLNRATSLLEETEECSEHARLDSLLAQAQAIAGNLDEALVHGKRAVERAQRLGSRDCEAMALHVQGRALIASDRVKEGLALIDEASAMAMGGELGIETAGTVYCGTIFACRNIGDWGRAAEWTDASQRWCAREHVRGFPGLCRLHRSEILRLRGALDEAESDVRTAIDELLGFQRRLAGWGFHELGEIRRRRGDREGASEAFRRAAEVGFEPEPGLALLRLDERRPQSALRGLEAVLADCDMRAREQRAVTLPALVTVALAAGRHELAKQALGELEALADTYGTAAIYAACSNARGEIALAEGRADDAARELHLAHRRWREVECPYEAALAQAHLALALRARGDAEGAADAFEAALGGFDELGAEGESRRYRDLCDQAGPTAAVSRTFMFTDIEDSTRLLEALGDAAWEELLSWHDRALREILGAHGGEEVKQQGDGFFVAFAAPEAALRCAIAIQRKLERHRREHGFAPRVRIGVHAGEAAVRGEDYAGKGVNAAARIGAAAKGGEVLASSATLAKAGGGFEVSDARRLELKGLAEPVDVVAVVDKARPT